MVCITILIFKHNSHTHTYTASGHEFFFRFRILPVCWKGIDQPERNSVGKRCSQTEITDISQETINKDNKDEREKLKNGKRETNRKRKIDFLLKCVCFFVYLVFFPIGTYKQTVHMLFTRTNNIFVLYSVCISVCNPRYNLVDCTNL